jgi:glycosyltransferase involved in cell wall biosynthesis
MADPGPSFSDPVHVLLVADDDSFDRLGSIVQHLCVGAIDDPVRLRVLVRTNRHNLPDAIGPSPVMVIRHRPWTRDRDWPDAVLESLEEDPPTVVHALSAKLCRWIYPMAAEWDCTLLAHVTDVTDMRHYGRLLRRPSVLGAVVTLRLNELVARYWPGLRERTRLIPLGVPASNEPACLDDPQRVPPAIVTTPLSRDCELDLVFRALQTLIQSGHEVQLFILAAGWCETALRREVDRLKLHGYVTFAGSMSDWETVSAAMSGADFFIEPNPRRRFSAHALTAMANGLAILAPHGTLEDYLIDGSTARLFDSRRSGDLAEKWGQLLQDRSAARLLGQSALDYARAHHQATRMVAATVALYHEAHTAAIKHPQLARL